MHATHEKSNEEPLSYDEVLIVKVCQLDVLNFSSNELSLCPECIGDEGQES